MKRIIYFMLVILVCSIYAGCSENEIELYNQTTRINFYGTMNIRTFVDKDYLKEETYVIDSFTVRIQGDHLKENRDLCVKVTPNSDYLNSVDVILDSKYTYTKLDTVCQDFFFKINLPKVKAGKNVYGCYLEFDLDNPLHQFEKGLVEKNKLILNVRWDLEPNDWDDWEFGSYSDEKYMFIMDVCKRVWDELDYDDFDKVKEVYKEYREAGNPPILGEAGDEFYY